MPSIYREYVLLCLAYQKANKSLLGKNKTCSFVKMDMASQLEIIETNKMNKEILIHSFSKQVFMSAVLNMA